MNIQDVLSNIKAQYEAAITTATFGGAVYENGLKAKEALIRSQSLIHLLHDAVKSQLIDEGVSPEFIFPALGHMKPEISVEGFLKKKNQDVCVVPRPGIINDQILSINVRSQLSSMMKNIDTLYERTFAEALNIHLKYPSLTMGEVYLIPTHEYDDRAMLENEVRFKKVSKLETYIQMFQAINLRQTNQGADHRYERVTLLIVDFTRAVPKLYSTIQDLIDDGLVPADTTATMKQLDFGTFSHELLETYGTRFDVNALLAK